MKPVEFDYRSPASLDEALDVLAVEGDDASVLAGGQSLVPLLNMRLARPGMLLDVNRVVGLDGVDVEGEELVVGALVRARRVETDATVARFLPVLRAATCYIAHPQIRNRTTVGGSIAHADPSSELPSVLAALGGSVTLVSQRGERSLAWDEFFLSVFMTARAPDELLTAVRFPIPRDMYLGYDEVARRPGDFPVAGLCSGLVVEDGVVSAVRLAAAGVADRPVRLSAAEAVLTGNLLDDRSIREASTTAAEEVDPPSDVHGSGRYRRGVLSTLVEQTLVDQQVGRAA